MATRRHRRDAYPPVEPNSAGGDARDTDCLRILQITDTHLFPKPADTSGYGLLAGVDTRASMEAVLDMALNGSTPSPDLLLVTGDIAQEPHAAAYAVLHEAIAARYQGDVLCLPGNHDEPELAPSTFARQLWSRRGWQVLVLDSHVHGEERGELAERELERLRYELENSNAHHILAAVHHPPLELASPLDHGRIKNGARLLELLAADGRVRGILFGHVHQAIYAEIGDLALYGSPSTCVQFKPLVGQFALDSQAPGCRWLNIKDNGEIVSRVQRLADGSFPAHIF